MHAFFKTIGKVKKVLSCTVTVFLPIQKIGQFSGKTFTLYSFYNIFTIKQIKLDCTLNASHTKLKN